MKRRMLEGLNDDLEPYGHICCIVTVLEFVVGYYED
jgi:hypothetical protein